MRTGAARAVTVGCSDSVYGDLARNWRQPGQGALIAGPLAWPYLRHYSRDASRTFATHEGLAPASKALALLDVGHTARVVVPAGERGRLSLDYTNVRPRRPHAGLYRVSDGARTVIFRACARGEGFGGRRTQFAGSFIVAGAHCAEIDVYVDGARAPLRRFIPFGVSAARCRG